MKSKLISLAGLACLVLHTSGSIAQQRPLWENQAFQLYSDRVVQNGFSGKAISGTSLSSDYQSPASLFQSPVVIFKFSINGKDNEMRPGSDHHFTCYGQNGVYTTPLIEFGRLYMDDKHLPDNSFMAPNTRLTIRLDMRSVLADMNKNGYYTSWNGSRIYKDDLKSILVAGATYPLSWDFDNLFQKPDLHMKDPDADGIYETTIVLNEEKKERDLASSWQLSRDIKAFPQYQSPHPIADAIYNLSLEEMEKAIEPDSTFRTGKEWAGVWTRDISYSITLAMAFLQPAVAIKSLMRKVKNGKIIQDTGTGGAYPVSTDRMIWAMAAWQVYLTTGDKNWLESSYRIIRQSLEDDRINAYDAQTGLIKGESSFLDWREQSYPKWMQPADIYESLNLGTNAVHYQASRVASLMAKELHQTTDATRYAAYAKSIAQAINRHLWMPDKGYYGQYLYGRIAKILSPRSEALGEALCVLFGIADANRSRSVIQKTPQLPFGIPTFYPQISGISPYHNRSVWPFVQAYWGLASAKAGNEEAVMRSIAAIYRPAALFLTNKENYVVDNGDYKGTEINSSNMLWSLSGNIAIVHKILFGLSFETNGLYVSPFVPQALGGKRILSNIHYRDALIDISLEGFGNTIREATINGKPVRTVFISANSKGRYQIQIQLSNEPIGGTVEEVKNLTSPPTPLATKVNNHLSWSRIEQAKVYDIVEDGKTISSTTDTSFRIPKNGLHVYQVMARDAQHVPSFASEPVINSSIYQEDLEAETLKPLSDKPFKGYSGKGFIETSMSLNQSFSLTTQEVEDGMYVIDLRYANGAGPVNTDNKCGVRSLFVNDKQTGVFVFPQRGVDEWSNWGYSNSLLVHLKKGRNTLRIEWIPENENMNGEWNGAMIDLIRIRKR